MKVKIDNRELPPKLRSGRVTPTTGRTPIVIDIFVNIKNKNIQVILPDNIFEK